MAAWLATQPLLGLLLWGLFAYSVVPVALATLEATWSGEALVREGNAEVRHFPDLLFFNFTTITTVGYGDFRPVSFARGLSMMEAIWGLVLFGIILAVATIKLLQAPNHAIAFSRYGYYSLQDQRFMVIFLNTTHTVLVNPEMCSYFRQGTEWHVRPAYSAPFIRFSVWTFFIDRWEWERLLAGPSVDNCLRFGITGQLGLATVSASVEYEPENIIVIPNRNELVVYTGFRKADLQNKDFRDMFHYRPLDCLTLAEHFARAREKEKEEKE